MAGGEVVAAVDHHVGGLNEHAEALGHREFVLTRLFESA